MTLAEKIEKRIGELPASHGGYINVAPSNLRGVLSFELLQKIAKEAAAEAEDHFRDSSSVTPSKDG